MWIFCYTPNHIQPKWNLVFHSWIEHVETKQSMYPQADYDQRCGSLTYLDQSCWRAILRKFKPRLQFAKLWARKHVTRNLHLCDDSKEGHCTVWTNYMGGWTDEHCNNRKCDTRGLGDILKEMHACDVIPSIQKSMYATCVHTTYDKSWRALFFDPRHILFFQLKPFLSLCVHRGFSAEPPFRKETRHLKNERVKKERLLFYIHTHTHTHIYILFPALSFHAVDL